MQQQRENLYQKLEALRGQGILLSPNMTIVSTAPIAPSGGVATGAEDGETTAASPPPPLNTASSPTPSTTTVDLGRRKTSNDPISSSLLPFFFPSSSLLLPLTAPIVETNYSINAMQVNRKKKRKRK